MKTFIKDNWFKVGLLSVLLIISFAFLYYFAFFLPHKEQTQIERQDKLSQEQKEEINIKQTPEDIKNKQDSSNLEKTKTQQVNACVKKAEDTAIDNFYIECLNNPEVGGSEEKCNISDRNQTISYIRYAKAVSFGVFQIDKQLTTDLNTCTKLYGK